MFIVDCLKYVSFNSIPMDLRPIETGGEYAANSWVTVRVLDNQIRKRNIFPDFGAMNVRPTLFITKSLTKFF